MKAKKFEDLFVWQKARILVQCIYQITNTKKFSDLSLKDQIRRAAVSIISNIAEGFERGGREELIYFLYIAKGSASEVRAQLYVAYDCQMISKKDFINLKDHIESVSKLLYRFIEGVKVSKYKGLKFKKQKNKDLKNFEKKLLKIINGKV